MTDEPSELVRRTVTGRVAGARTVLAAAAIVSVVAVAVGTVPWLPALAGFAIVAAAALVAGGSSTATLSQDGASTPAIAPLIGHLIEGLPDPVVVLDRAGIVVALNARARAFAAALRIGEPATLALRMPEIIEAIRNVTASGEAQQTRFSERVPVDRWYEAHLLPVRLDGDAGARPEFVLMSLHDLTPLRRVEEMRADFVANASHELRTPLATLTGFIETLQGSAREDVSARDRFLAIMKAQAQRMARLIDDLLSLSRIELNAHLRPRTSADLVAIARQVCDAMQTLARDRGVDIVTTFADAPLTVLGDRDELARVCENLIENALKYGGAGKRIEIRALRESASDGRGEEAVLSVRDFGPGIAPEHLPRLTERFYRIDSVQSRAEGGTGLGLALVKHILNRHGGRFTIESRVGEGATFTIRLPAAEFTGAPA